MYASTCESTGEGRVLKNIFVANASISPFNAHTMHIKSFYTQHISIKTLYPGGIQTRVFSFLRWMWCPLRHAARAESEELRNTKIRRGLPT
jgi:hypothetical protein